MDTKMKFLFLTFFVSLFCLVQISAQSNAKVTKSIEKTVHSEAPMNTVVVINDGKVEVYKWNGEMPKELSAISEKYELQEVLAETSDMNGHMEVVEEETVTTEDGQTVVKKTKKVVSKDGKACSDSCKKACEEKGKAMNKEVQSDVQVKGAKKDCSQSCSDKSKGVKSDVQMKDTAKESKAVKSCCKSKE